MPFQKFLLLFSFFFTMVNAKVMESGITYSINKIMCINIFFSINLMSIKLYILIFFLFFSQRYRFTEAYLVNRDIQTMEQTILESANEDVASRVQLICQWREGLIVSYFWHVNILEFAYLCACNICHFLSIL